MDGLAIGRRKRKYHGKHNLVLRRVSRVAKVGFRGSDYDTASWKAPTETLRMPKYVIEREIPGAGDLTPEELQGIAQTSCGVLREMGPEINWVHSYVTGDKIYCVYIAPNEELVRKHAEQGGPSPRCSGCPDRWGASLG